MNTRKDQFFSRSTDLGNWNRFHILTKFEKVIKTKLGR